VISKGTSEEQNNLAPFLVPIAQNCKILRDYTLKVVSEIMAAANIGYLLERGIKQPVITSENPFVILDAIKSPVYNSLKSKIASGGIQESEWKIKTPNQIVTLDSIAGLNAANLQEVPKCHARGKTTNHTHDASAFMKLISEDISLKSEGSYKGLTLKDDLQSATVWVAGSKFFIEKLGFENLRKGLEKLKDSMSGMAKFSNTYQKVKNILEDMPLMYNASKALYKQLPPLLMQ